MFQKEISSITSERFLKPTCPLVVSVPYSSWTTKVQPLLLHDWSLPITLTSVPLLFETLHIYPPPVPPCSLSSNQVYIRTLWVRTKTSFSVFPTHTSRHDQVPVERTFIVPVPSRTLFHPSSIDCDKFYFGYWKDMGPEYFRRDNSDPFRGI